MQGLKLKKRGKKRKQIRNVCLELKNYPETVSVRLLI